MTKETYKKLENYMLDCMKDSAHDKEHVYRVLYVALDIASKEKEVDYDVLVSACLLHDIARQEQNENPKLCHAEVGSEKAYKFLIENDFEKAFAEKVKHCISSHRFRKNNVPESTEAKVLFDADKIDAAGTLGIARTLVYQGAMCEPLYSLTSDGRVSDGTDEEIPSFFQEYKYKLEKIYSRFYTDRGKEIAEERRKTAESFYNNMLREVTSSYDNGIDLLGKIIGKL
ncbi:MAG: HD domain-containing protein [Ruminococcaceae bacterium]|nr:HD domain-containing protein [Oscillospiraceae bacterium]